MKNLIQITILAGAALFFSITVNAQSSTTANSFEGRIAKAAVDGAQLGSLACENAAGERVLCNGSVEETILGIVTNLPYITLNKPSSPDASRYVFNALVSNENGAISVGDKLTAGKDGKLVKTVDTNVAYAVALESSDGNSQLVQVKIIRQ